MRLHNLSGLKVKSRKVEVLVMISFVPLMVMGQSGLRNASQAKPRVYIDWKDTSFLSTESSQPFDAIAAFNHACPEAEAVSDKRHANFVLRMNHQRGPGSTDLYRWNTEAAGGVHLEEQSAGKSLNLVLIHMCNSSVMNIWHHQQSASNRK